MRREDLSVLQTEVEVASGFTTKDIYPAVVMFFVGLPFGVGYAIVLGMGAAIGFNILKKQLGSSEKVYEFFRYLGRPKMYKRRA